MPVDTPTNARDIEPPGPNAVHVWTATLPAAEGIMTRCQELLSPDERDRAGRMQVQSPRDLFVLGRGLLRALVGRYLGVPAADVRFAYSAFGRPSLDGRDTQPPLHFSVSHSGSQVVLAFAGDARVGVDVERVRTDADCDAIAARFFAPGEQAALAALGLGDRMGAFFACWTRKEALLKAIGLGISQGLNRVEVTCRPGDAPRVRRSELAEVDPARWALIDLDVPPGYRAALAVSLTGPAVSCFPDAAAVVLASRRA